MYTVYSFVTGPLAWIAFIIFIAGSITRFAMLYSLARKKDGVVFQYMSLKFALRSILHWIIPFGATNMRKNPAMTIVTFLFHICLLLVPIFLFAHIVLWSENFSVSWISLPDWTADFMTLVVLGSCIFFFARRLVLDQVKYLTTWVDFAILIIVAAPFFTGFWAYHQWAGSDVMTIVHIVSGELMLAIIPFTKLFHMFLFPFTRGYIGSEFGAVRMAKDW
ncbi:MAG: nitrate reductase [Desulfobacteraceae bacterium]